MERPSAHRHACIVADVPQNDDGTTRHSERHPIARVSVDGELTTGHAGSEAMHPRRSAFDPDASRAPSTHVEEVAQAGCVAAGRDRERRDVRFVQAGALIRPEVVELDPSFDTSPQREGHDLAHGVPAPSITRRRWK